jgi:hypothetical protein
VAPTIPALTLRLVLVIGIIAEPSEGAPMSEISDAPPAPWLNLPRDPKPSPTVNLLFSEILGRVQELLGARYGGCWLSADPDGSNIRLNFSAVSPTAADQAAVEAIVKSHPDFPYPLNPLVAVPYSYDDLVGFYEAITDALERRGISGIGVGVRGDLGKLVVELPSPDSPAIGALSEVVPQDAVLFTVVPPPSPPC